MTEMSPEDIRRKIDGFSVRQKKVIYYLIERKRDIPTIADVLQAGLSTIGKDLTDIYREFGLDDEKIDDKKKRSLLLSIIEISFKKLYPTIEAIEGRKADVTINKHTPQSRGGIVEVPGTVRNSV